MYTPFEDNGVSSNKTFEDTHEDSSIESENITGDIPYPPRTIKRGRVFLLDE